MKKSNVSEKTIRTMAIGLSTVMAMSSPMAAMAAEGEDGTPGEKTALKKSTEEQKNNQQSLEGKVEKVQEKAADLTEEKTETKPAGAVKEAENAEEKAVELTEQEGIKKPVASAGENLDDVATNSKGDNKAVKKIETTENKLEDAKEEAQNLETEMNNAETAVENAENLADQANQKIEKAQDKVENKIDKINNATSVDEAQKAADQAQKIADKANQSLEEASTEVKKAEQDYESAKKAAKEAEEAYKKALNDAEGKTTESLEELSKAKKAAKELEEKAEKVVKAAQMNAADKAALEIIRMQSEIEGLKKPNNWRKEDELFKQIMVNYYLPKELGNSNFKVADDFERYPEDHNKNKFAVTLEDGTVKYYNYKLDKSGKKLIIFEKTEEVTQEATEDRYVVYDENSVIARELTKEQLEALEQKNDIVKDKQENYYAKKVDSQNNTVTPVEDSKKLINDNVTKQTVSEESIKTETKVTDDGMIVEQTTGTVTTTTKVTGVSLNGGSGFASRDEAEKAAWEEAEKTLNDEEKVTDVDADITATATATAEVSYVTTFETKIDLTGSNIDRSVLDWMKDSIESKSSKEIIKDCAKSAFDGQEEYRVLFAKTSDIKHKKGDKYSIKSGTLTVTYGKVSKIPVEQWIFEKIFEGDKAQVDEIKAEIPEGSQLLDYDVLDEHLGTGTGYYLKSNTVRGEGKAFKEEKAEQRAKKDALRKAQKEADELINKAFAEKIAESVQGTLLETKANVLKKSKNDVVYEATGLSGVFENDTEYDVIKDENITEDDALIINSNVTYSYEGTFDKEKYDKEENVLLNTKTWKADKLTFEKGREEVRDLTNKNYVEYMAGKGDNVFLEETDKEFNEYLNAAKDKKEILKNHQAIVDAARKAKDKARTAAEEVGKLRKAIRNLKDKKLGTAAELRELQARLDLALEEFGNAKEESGKLSDLLEESRKALEETEKRLTPAPVPAPAPAPAPNPGPAAPAARPAAPAAVTIVPEATPLAANPVNDNADEEEQEENPAVVIEDEETPLADGIGDADDGNGDEKDLTTIEEDEVPLAAGEMDGMSWWWLLLVIILGATGYKMYKDHQEKKKAAVEAVEAEKSEEE